MLASQDRPRIVMVLANYCDGSLDSLGQMLRSPGALLSLSDAGAHSMTICDGTIHTFVLTYWVRDRAHGLKFTLEEAVRMMTSAPAKAFRLNDRGVIAPGYKADLNVIDLDRLTCTDPHYVHDLPAGATRLLQSVSGYRATIVSGVVTRENDEATGALPGHLIRFGHASASKIHARS
jgi:N-acyl-D-aspartate/D-glutamate deacylase